MKILNSQQIRAADAYTIQNEPIASVDLMERAATKCVEWILENKSDASSFNIFCGIGNNGGDGLVIARLLAEAGKKINLFIVRFSENTTPDFDVNYGRIDTSLVTVNNIRSEKDVPIVPSGIIVDALLGTGVTRKLSGILESVSSSINTSGLEVVSIDIPSGVFDSGNTIENLSVAIRATNTLCFQVPRLPLFLPDCSENIGSWTILDIGLHSGFLDSTETPFKTTELPTVTELIKHRAAFSHKGTFGHALLIGGSYGKVGAVILSSEAALRAGAGLCTIYAPKCAYEILQERIPEAMVKTCENQDELSGASPSLTGHSVGIGPGIGTSEQTQRFVRNVISSVGSPLVLDADGLNCLALQKDLLSQLPEKSILTPHPKEFERLFGKTKSSEEQLNLLRKKVVEHELIIILKGRYTAVGLPNGDIRFNTSGNPGMATGGSGDVLTGIITGLLAQQYTPENAAILGVYLHGLAGDLATESLSEESVIASDIISHLPDAFKRIHQE